MATQTAKKRVFVSFDYDNDLELKNLLVGQSKNSDSPFEISDYSLKEAAPMKTWEEKAEAKIKMSDVVVVITGTKTHSAPGVLKEIAMARKLKKPIFQICGRNEATCKAVPDAGRYYNWTWDNLKTLLKP